MSYLQSFYCVAKTVVFSSLLILLMGTPIVWGDSPPIGAGGNLLNSLPTEQLVTSVMTQYATAALDQSKSHDGNKIYYSGPQGMDSVRSIYTSILAVGAILEQRDPTPATCDLLSHAYAEIGWFAHELGESNAFGVRDFDLVERATKLNPNNALAWYALAQLLGSGKGRIAPDGEERIATALGRALQLDPEFPEAWLALGLHYSRINNRAEADRAREKFLVNLKHYKPELNYFDSGYPSVGDVIGLPNDRVVERRIYRNDIARFSIK